jgi:hypothetical protein
MIALPNSMLMSNYLECWVLELDEAYLFRALIGFRLIQTQFSIIPLCGYAESSS